MAAAITAAWTEPAPSIQPVRPALPESARKPQLIELSGVFRGREFTRKDRRLTSGLAPLDALLGGGIARGRISEIIGNPGSGRTSIAAAFAASATDHGEAAAWVDASGAFDPASIAAAGVDLGRILWASFPRGEPARPATREGRVLKAAELVLEAGGFGLVVVDFGDTPRAILESAALRVARAAERSGAAVVVIAPRRMCGTFAAQSLVVHRIDASFSRFAAGAPVIFDGLTLEAAVARNKLGGAGGRAIVGATIDAVPSRRGGLDAALRAGCPLGSNEPPSLRRQTQS
ncbi:MAG TPA: hypothetical protein VEC38_00075 [Candidatus Binataceae bacterium]|nr:hypothetical protein [Candidatus Binataceae bacterium]